MTTLRDGLGEPLIQLPAEVVQEIRAFLDGQSRIKAAAWARHLEPGNPPDVIDHHILLALDDEDCAKGDINALESGIRLPHIGAVGPTWQDFFALSELPAVQTFATMLWEQTVPGGDPLDYRYTYEPFEPEPAAVGRFGALLESEPAIRRVGAVVEKLWNGNDLVEERVQLSVGARSPANALDVVLDAARETILVGYPSFGSTLGRSRGEAAVLYEAAA